MAEDDNLTKRVTNWLLDRYVVALIILVSASVVGISSFVSSVKDIASLFSNPEKKIEVVDFVAAARFESGNEARMPEACYGLQPEFGFFTTSEKRFRTPRLVETFEEREIDLKRINTVFILQSASSASFAVTAVRIKSYRPRPYREESIGIIHQSASYSFFVESHPNVFDQNLYEIYPPETHGIGKNAFVAEYTLIDRETGIVSPLHIKEGSVGSIAAEFVFNDLVDCHDLMIEFLSGDDVVGATTATFSIEEAKLIEDLNLEIDTDALESALERLRHD